MRVHWFMKKITERWSLGCASCRVERGCAVHGRGWTLLLHMVVHSALKGRLTAFWHRPGQPPCSGSRKPRVYAFAVRTEQTIQKGAGFS